jgi:hypothetical protein
MKYVIPVVYLDKLTKKINHIKNKGGDITFNVGPERKEEKYLSRVDNKGFIYKDQFPTYIPVVDVEVEGKYIINGWEFVATIEHKTNGNIIRAINDDFKIPEKYKTCGPACEHCNIVRDRKDTYLIYNKDKDEWKQVGKTCLKDFTGGLDADTCAVFDDLENYLIECQKLEDGDDFTSFGSGDDNSFNGDMIKKLGYSLILNHGYIKNGTSKLSSVGQLIANYKKDPKIANNDTPASDEDIKKVDNWVDEKIKKTNQAGNYSQYLANAVVAWKEKYPERRDLALILSLFAVYFKDMQNQKQTASNPDSINKISNYIGSIGDNIEFKVGSYRLLYTKDNTAFGYYASPTFVYQVTDDKGNVIIVETTKAPNDTSWDGKTISGKVKAQKEYKGIKQTIVNRIKILGESLSVVEALDSL